MNNLLRGIFTFVMIACSTGHAMESTSPTPRRNTNHANAPQQRRMDGQAQEISVRQVIVAGCQEKKPLTQAQLLSYVETLDKTTEFNMLRTEQAPERIRMVAEPLDKLIKDTGVILTQEEAKLDKDKPRSWAPYTLAAAGVCCGINFLKVRFCGSSGDEPCEKMALFLGGLGVAEWKASREECKHTKEERIGIQNGLTLVRLIQAKTIASLQETTKRVAGIKVAQAFRRIIQETRAQRPLEVLTTTFLREELSTKVTELQRNFSEYITVSEADHILRQVLAEGMIDQELEEQLDTVDQEIHDDEAPAAREAELNNTTLTLEEKKKQ